MQGDEHNNVFALKTFQEASFVAEATEERFNRELKANRYAPQHSRIVRVIAAFKHRRRYHLVFPWADDGSLLDLWKNYTPIHIKSCKNSRPATWCSEAWLVRECMGIAEALAATHDPANDDHSRSLPQIHADVKPENILCFSSDNTGPNSITLKLADFGEAIQVTQDPDVQRKKLPHIQSNRPPEYKPFGRPGFKYDIWCLGCLYLEFITWFLVGWEGLEAFKDNRENEGDDPSIAGADGAIELEDTFFKRVKKSRIPKVKVGRRSTAVNNSDKHTTKSSLWITSSVGIECKVKESVRIVSLLTILKLTCEANMYHSIPKSCKSLNNAIIQCT